MAIEPIDLTGGKSVFCFNKYQIDSARELVSAKDESGDKIRAEMERLRKEWSRNEMAAMAFVLLDELNNSSPE